MKKKVLFVIESLTIGGAEKSLVNLLNLFDYDKYDVDLQLFSYGGVFQKYLPKEVNLLGPLPYFEFCENGLVKGLKASKFSVNQRIKMILSRISYSIELRRKKHSNPEKAIEFWKKTKKCFNYNSEHYDVAVAYAQGTPTFYVSDCINADKKIAWVNSNYKPTDKYHDYVESHYASFNAIVGVSDTTTEGLKKHFTAVYEKFITVYDINDKYLINRMSEEFNPIIDEMNYEGLKIVTVGRMCMNKGYDLAVEACNVLNNNGLNFKWYIVGDGPLKAEIIQQINDYGLNERMIVLGEKSNPYPYMKCSDLYVQTSRFEGFCLTLAEARILNKPCVTTNFECVYNQMIQEKNGLVVDMNAHAIAAGIERMINDDELRDSIVEYLKTEKKGNAEEIEKVYELFK